MNSEEAIEYIHGTLKFGSKLGLANITELLRRMGNPQEKYKCIHIAGTNGKGSTASMLYAMLCDAGLKVGLYTSPYLERFSERIRANTIDTYNNEIDDASLAEIVTELREHVNAMVAEGFNHPTEFEITTALGFTWFARQGIDYCVVEVGLGGRFDATNVITPILSVITHISLDHTAILGDTLTKIAFEKSGIIKPGIPVVSYAQEEEPAIEIARNAHERGSELLSCRLSDVIAHGSRFDYNDGTHELKDLHCALVGAHQQQNASVAIKAAYELIRQGVPLTDTNIRNGLDSVVWPCRFERCCDEPYIILDGAHNPDGAQALRKTIDAELCGKHITLVTGILRDKDYNFIIDTLCSAAEHVVAVTADSPRAIPAPELADIINAHNCGAHAVCADSTEEAIDTALELGKKPDSVILFAGSLYMCGDVRARLGQRHLINR